MIDEVIILLCRSKGTADFVRKIFHIDIFIIARCHCFNQFCCMLKRKCLKKKSFLFLNQGSKHWFFKTIFEDLQFQQCGQQNNLEIIPSQNTKIPKIKNKHRRHSSKIYGWITYKVEEIQGSIGIDTKGGWLSNISVTQRTSN